jgi:hypothetical protein
MEALSQSQAVKEALQEKHATIPRQVVAGKRNADVLGTTTMAQLALQKCEQKVCPDNLTKSYVIREAPQHLGITRGRAATLLPRIAGSIGPTQITQDLGYN